jgi:4,5-dihydroxyphthalate decarboxylase
VTDKTTLHTLLGDYPNTRALKAGAVQSDLLDFSFSDLKIANRGFKPLVRDGAFDLGELAMVTFLQAKVYHKPYILLPVVVLARGQHHTIAYNPTRGELRPADLAGRRVGVRAYTQTTGTWLRGILAEEYGLDFRHVRWITFEDAHLAEYQDPPWAERAPAGKTLAQMLLDGEVDAAILGDEPVPAPLKRLIPDADAASRRWAERHGGVPINHMLVIRESIARARPDLLREVFRLFHQSKHAAKLPEDGGALDPFRFGVEAVRPSLEVLIDDALAQQLIPRRFAVDELFDATARALHP